MDNPIEIVPNASPNLWFLKGEGEMRQRIRDFDWSKTKLGPPKSWSPSLKIAVGIMLDNASPAYIAWGPHFVQLYNDAYIPILGTNKHPSALGLSTMETWQEIWDFVGPLFNSIIETGHAVSMNNKLFPMLRNGYLEECYFTFSYSPLADEHGNYIGVYALPWETTEDFVRNRRANAIRTLTQNLSHETDMPGIFASLGKTIHEFPQDIPFGLLYEIRPDRSSLSLAVAVGIERDSYISPEFLVPERHNFYQGLINIEQPVVASRPCPKMFPGRHFSSLPNQHTSEILIKPLSYGGAYRPDAYLVFATNPMRPNDEEQKEFFLSVRLHLENAIRRVNKHELERREQDHHFHSIMEILPCMVWMTNAELECIYANDTWLKLRGRSFEQERGNGWIEGVHPNDVQLIEQYKSLMRRLVVIHTEYRILDGQSEYRWIMGDALPSYDINGDFSGYIGTCVDVTDQKQSEQELLSSQSELRMLYDRLQTVRDEERRALAREVHDQLGQILSAAKIDIKLLEDDFFLEKGKLSRRKVLTELRSARNTIDNSIQVVRRLATELRPPELEGQCLRAAIVWHVRDFERRTKIICNLELPDEMPPINDAIGITILRICQEAMTNVLRHAHANQVRISLRCVSDFISLCIADNGIGISTRKAGSQNSIGLKGMRERAAIAGGEVIIESTAPSGTLVSITIPLKNDDENYADIRNLPPSSGDVL